MVGLGVGEGSAVIVPAGDAVDGGSVCVWVGIADGRERVEDGDAVTGWMIGGGGWFIRQAARRNIVKPTSKNLSINLNMEIQITFETVFCTVQ